MFIVRERMTDDSSKCKECDNCQNLGYHNHTDFCSKTQTCKVIEVLDLDKLYKRQERHMKEIKYHENSLELIRLELHNRIKYHENSLELIRLELHNRDT